MGAESDFVSSGGQTVAATPTAQVRRPKEKLERQLVLLEMPQQRAGPAASS
jgi:hypothetical protein